VAVASARPYASLHLAPDRSPYQHPTTQFFTGQTPFLPPNQQHQSTECINIQEALKQNGVMRNVRHFCGLDYSRRREESEHFHCDHSELKDAMLKILPDHTAARQSSVKM